MVLIAIPKDSLPELGLSPALCCCELVTESHFVNNILRGISKLFLYFYIVTERCHYGDVDWKTLAYEYQLADINADADKLPSWRQWVYRRLWSPSWKRCCSKRTRVPPSGTVFFISS
jgi:hypothetical protein